MIYPVGDTGFDFAALAADLKACKGYGSNLLINELLLDVRDWKNLDQPELTTLLHGNPIAAVAALELTTAAQYISDHSQSESEFLKPFTNRNFLSNMIFLGCGEPDPPLNLPTACVKTGNCAFDALLFMHTALRWAERFGQWAPRDLRDLMRINLQHPFLTVVANRNTTPEEAVIYQALSQIGIRVIPPPSDTPDHHLANWICETLGLDSSPSKARQQQLDFREAGGTHNSIFVVRALGGVDGYEVRGEIREDMGLIIDIGDREVPRASTAYIEHYVIQVINEQTDLYAELVEHNLVLRWYDTDLSPDDLGRIIYQALKDNLVLSTISVNLLFDPIRISSLRPSIFGYRDERAKEMQRRNEEQTPFVFCRSCASYSPLAFCIVSVDRPPCCNRSYDELAVLAQFTRSTDQISINRGVCQDRVRGHYMGAEKIVRHLNHEHFSNINLHSVRDNPHPTTALTQCIAWYLEELDILCVISQDYTGRSPDGKTFSSLLTRVAGYQTPGYVGVGEEYLLSARFAAAEGGMSHVGWMNSSLKTRLNIRAEHIATEKDCINMAGLKEHLAAWRH